MKRTPKLDKMLQRINAETIVKALHESAYANQTRTWCLETLKLALNLYIKEANPPAKPDKSVEGYRPMDADKLKAKVSADAIDKLLKGNNK